MHVAKVPLVIATKVLEKIALPGRRDCGALRLITYAIKDGPAGDFPAEGSDVLLEFDYTAILPRRSSPR